MKTDRRHEKNRALFDAWKDVPAGRPVRVQRANGTVLDTVTEGPPYLINNAHALVRVVDIPGGTRLSRVTLLTP